jgi:hypothetical protein
MINNYEVRRSTQGMMFQSGIMSPPIVSNRRLENINCIIEPTQDMGGLFLGDIVCTLKT